MEKVLYDEKMTIGEVLAADKRAKWVLAHFHIGGCHHCSVDESLTVKDVTEDFGVPTETLVLALNKLAEM